ncbi:mimecan-like [Hippocampus comes]|uniref:mimecan-like n=1 Tax=Hippocampus comes TaxID=109280 RepID=UPI00094E7FA1|nr:PREDICTED: mimecan-like [Hippocampus comes]
MLPSSSRARRVYLRAEPLPLYGYLHFLFSRHTSALLLSVTLSFAEGAEFKNRGTVETDVHDSDFLQDADQAVASKANGNLTCLLCVCLREFVYCEEVSPEMSAVPELPKETTYFYTRFNKITKITNNDFADMTSLKIIDLSGNLITEIEDEAFCRLANLEELNLSDNRLTKLPALPGMLRFFNANSNRLTSKGLKTIGFKKFTRLAYLYLGYNRLKTVPRLPESLHIVHLHNNNINKITETTFCQRNNPHYIRRNLRELRLDGNPIQLWKHPNSFNCLLTLPIGWYK